MLPKQLSNGESIIINYLVSHKYSFEYKKSYKALNGLKVNFFIKPTKNFSIPTIIEYDGPKHFYNKKSNDLNTIIANDLKENAFCILHGIYLIRLEDMKGLSILKYIDTIKKISRILDEELPVHNHGINLRFISIKPKDLSYRFFTHTNTSKLNMLNFLNYIENQTYVSISDIQMRFNIGFNRASLIMNSLTKKGIVSKKKGSKPRIVLKRNNYNKFNLNPQLDLNLNNVQDDPVTKDFISKLNKYSTISISELQRIYNIGYNRSRKIIVYLAKRHLISKRDGIHKRKVLINHLN